MRDTWIGRFRRLLDGKDGEILGDPRFAVTMAEHALRLTPTAPDRVSCEAGVGRRDLRSRSKPGKGAIMGAL